MFKNTFQSGFLSILYSIGSKPLQIWDKKGARPLALPAGRLARGVLLRRRAEGAARAPPPPRPRRARPPRSPTAHGAATEPDQLVC